VRPDSVQDGTGFEPTVPSKPDGLLTVFAQAVIGMENACKRGGQGGRGEPRVEAAKLDIPRTLASEAFA